MNQRSNRCVRRLYGNVSSRPSSGDSQPEQRVVLDDGLDAAELTQALGAVAEADAARLDAAERRFDAEVVHQRVVHAHAARLQPPGERRPRVRRRATRRCPTGPSACRSPTRSAASASATRITGSTGPKVSSRITAMSGVASAISVGAKNCPGRSLRRAPPVTTRAAAGDGVGDLLLGPFDLRREGDRADVDVGGVRPPERRRRLAQPRRSRRRPARRSDRRRGPRRTRARCGCRPGRCARTRSRPRRARRAAGRRRRARSSPTCRPARARRGSSARPRAWATRWPVAALPVKKIMSAAAVSAAPASPRPATTWNTPSGRPASRPERGDPQRRHAACARTASARPRCRRPAARCSPRSC